MDKKKIILDCDPGMDDSMAIVMACKSEALDVLAVTTVNGNYPAEVTCVNALKVLEMIGRTDVPVGKGMVAPMVRATPVSYTHLDVYKRQQLDLHHYLLYVPQGF